VFYGDHAPDFVVPRLRRRRGPVTALAPSFPTVTTPPTSSAPWSR